VCPGVLNQVFIIGSVGWARPLFLGFPWRIGVALLLELMFVSWWSSIAVRLGVVIFGGGFGEPPCRIVDGAFLHIAAADIFLRKSTLR
jgi:hypothetical protein